MTDAPCRMNSIADLLNEFHERYDWETKERTIKHLKLIRKDKQRRLI